MYKRQGNTMRTNSNGGNEKNSNQSSDKLLQIMEALAKERLPVRLQDLSAQVNMSQSTVLRYLNALLSLIHISCPPVPPDYVPVS